MVFDFSLEPVSRTDLPSKSVVVEKAKSLISNIPNWTKGKSFQYTLKEGDTTEVQTYHTSYNNEPWFARVSKHKLPFQLFKDGIFFNHTSNEQHYIELLKEVHEITATDLGIKGDETIDWNAFAVRYSFPFPLQDRHMNIWIMAVGPDNTSNEKQEFLILSIPRIPTTDNSKEFSYLVTSKYCSVEYLEYLPETEEVKWTMATTSHAGGVLPRFLQNPSIPSHIAVDVPCYINWARNK